MIQVYKWLLNYAYSIVELVAKLAVDC